MGKRLWVRAVRVPDRADRAELLKKRGGKKMKNGRGLRGVAGVRRIKRRRLWLQCRTCRTPCMIILELITQQELPPTFF